MTSGATAHSLKEAGGQRRARLSMALVVLPAVAALSLSACTSTSQAVHGLPMQIPAGENPVVAEPQAVPGRVWVYGDGKTTVYTNHEETEWWLTEYSTLARIAKLPDMVYITSRFGIDTEGALWGWGSDQYGSKGSIICGTCANGLRIQRQEGPFVDVSGASMTGKAVDSEGTVWTWGEGLLGSHGAISPHDDLWELQPVAGLPPMVKAIQAGITAYAIDSLGALWSWGSGPQGQLGDGVGTCLSSPDYEHTRLEPAPVQGLPPIVDVIAAPSSPPLAIAADGSVWLFGALTNAEGNDCLVDVGPHRIDLPPGTIDIGGGQTGYWVLTSDGSIYLLAGNISRMPWEQWHPATQSGPPYSYPNPYDVPVRAPVSAPPGSIQLVALDSSLVNPHHRLYALTDAGSVYGWGTVEDSMDGWNPDEEWELIDGILGTATQIEASSEALFVLAH